jgi:hypothetical protein
MAFERHSEIGALGRQLEGQLNSDALSLSRIGNRVDRHTPRSARAHSAGGSGFTPGAYARRAAVTFVAETIVTGWKQTFP